MLNYLEVAADYLSEGEAELNTELLLHAVGEQQAAFDNKGDHFYDILSAFHKSVRGSSPDGALYWYARILVGGGDPLIVARRLLAIASEDIGNADPRALQIALNAWDTFHRVGPAEGERAIAQAVVYCASAAKSNAVYNAFKAAVAAQKLTQRLRCRAICVMHRPRFIKSKATVKITVMLIIILMPMWQESATYRMRSQTLYFYQPEPRGLEIKIKDNRSGFVNKTHVANGNEESLMTSLSQWLMVAAGGAIGASARHGVALLMLSTAGGSLFMTLIVNIRVLFY